MVCARHSGSSSDDSGERQMLLDHQRNLMKFLVKSYSRDQLYYNNYNVLFK